MTLGLPVKENLQPFYRTRPNSNEFSCLRLKFSRKKGSSFYDAALKNQLGSFISDIIKGDKGIHCCDNVVILSHLKQIDLLGIVEKGN